MPNYNEKSMKREEDSREYLSSGKIGGYLFDGGMTESIAQNMQPLRQEKDLASITRELNGEETTDSIQRRSDRATSPSAGNMEGDTRFEVNPALMNNSMGMSMAGSALSDHVDLDNLDPALRKYKYDILASKQPQPGSELKSVAASAQSAAESSQRWSFTLRTDIPMLRPGESSK